MHSYDNDLKSKKNTYKNDTLHAFSESEVNPRGECSNVINQKRYNDLKETAKNKFNPEEFHPIPKKIHMIWVASEPRESQLKYIRSWANKNPSAEINLWCDSRFFKLYEQNSMAKKTALLKSKVSPEEEDSFFHEKNLRDIFHQANIASQSKSNEDELKLSIKELSKALSSEEFSKELLGNDSTVTPENIKNVISNFKSMVRVFDEKHFQFSAYSLGYTIVEWDNYKKDLLIKNKDKLTEIENLFKEYKNVKIRDISEVDLSNKDAYNHEMFGRWGGYPTASDICRYEILYQHGGIYTDIDLECKETIDFSKLKCHPELMLVGMAKPKKEEENNQTPYFANALLASHSKSNMLKTLIFSIGEYYNNLRGASFSGARYLARPNKSTIENTGPNKLRGHVLTALGFPRNDIHSSTQRIWDRALGINADVWDVIDHYFTFPEGLVEFETPEQADSATKAMV